MQNKKLKLEDLKKFEMEEFKIDDSQLKEILGGLSKGSNTPVIGPGGTEDATCGIACADGCFFCTSCNWCEHCTSCSTGSSVIW